MNGASGGGGRPAATEARGERRGRNRRGCIGAAAYILAVWSVESIDKSIRESLFSHHRIALRFGCTPSISSSILGGPCICIFYGLL